MKNIVIYTGELPDGKYTPSYELLATELAHADHALYLCSDLDAYRGGGIFAATYQIFDGKWLMSNEPVMANKIFNKSLCELPSDGTWVINHPILSHACDKDFTARLFPNESPRTVTVSSPEELESALKTLRSEFIVRKPIALYGGEGVWIGPREDIPTDVAYPFIVQEFIDGSNGIPGICTGRHDLRLMLLGDELVDSYVREPAEGGYVANVARGGSMRQVPLSMLPDSVRVFAFDIDKLFTAFPDRTYCIDVALDRDGSWKLIELNAPPGIPLMNEESKHIYIARLAKHLATCERTTNPLIRFKGNQ